MESTHEAQAWSAAHIALGSWHAKLKQMAKKAKLKDSCCLTQTTFATDAASLTLQLTKKSKIATVVSLISKPGPASGTIPSTPTLNSSFPPSVLKPPPVACPKTCKTLACDYVQGDIQETRITFRITTKPKDDLTSEQILLTMIGNLFQKYQDMDPKIAILPWHAKDASSLHPLFDP